MRLKIKFDWFLRNTKLRMRVPTCVYLNWRDIDVLQFGKEHVERKLLCRAKGERCLAAASSLKQIGASRASDLQ